MPTIPADTSSFAEDAPVTTQVYPLATGTTLDSLPNEVQQMVYRFVLRSDCPIVKMPSPAERSEEVKKRALNTSLLQLNKQISANARVALFDQNIVRIPDNAGAVYAPEMRSVELTADFAAAICQTSTLIPHRLAPFLAIPGLHTIVLCIYALASRNQSLRRFVGRDQRWKRLRCTDLGCFELEPSLEWINKLRGFNMIKPPKVYLRDCRLLDMLPPAKELAASYTSSQLQKLARLHLPYKDEITSRQGLVFDFAWWLRSYDDWRRWQAAAFNHGLSRKELSNVDDFYKSHLLATPEIPDVNHSFPTYVPIADIKIGPHCSRKLMESASEMLSYNLSKRIALQFRPDNGDGSGAN